MRLRSLVVLVLVLTCTIGKTQVIVNPDSVKSQPKVVANILVLGTKRTHDEVVFRELTFKSGDTVNFIQKEIQRSKSNLINTLLFNFVDIKETKIDSVFSDVVIVVKERWYIWPFPVFKFAEPNFNTWWLNKDFARTNYGVLLLWRNFRGWNEDLSIKAQFGYSKEFMAIYRIPYLTNGYKLGMQISANYTQQEEITIGTEDNKRIFFRSGTGKSRTEFGGRLSFFYRRKLYITHTWEFRYQNLQVVDSVARTTNDYFFKGAPHMEFPGLSYVVRYDKRDNKGYPLKGALLQLEAHKFGLSFVGQKNLNVGYFSGYIKKYIPMGYRWNWAGQIRGKYTYTKDLPYYFQQGLGYDNYVRGYEYYIIDGQHFLLAKSNLKYNLIKPKTYPIDFLKSTNFYMFHYAVYLNAFVDAGYVWDKFYFEKNHLTNQTNYSVGLGLDIVTFYDKVLRLEYAFNRQQQHGFYVHFVAPI